jgi:hypothetical protein
MTPEERNVISGIFGRMKQAEGQSRDAEADRFIADQIKAQPGAPYIMAQTIYVQEQALNNLSREVEALQAQVQQLQAQAQQPQSGGFLSSLFGGGQPQRPAMAPAHFRTAAPTAGCARPLGSTASTGTCRSLGTTAAPTTARHGLSRHGCRDSRRRGRRHACRQCADERLFRLRVQRRRQPIRCG